MTGNIVGNISFSNHSFLFCLSVLNPLKFGIDTQCVGFPDYGLFGMALMCHIYTSAFLFLVSCVSPPSDVYNVYKECLLMSRSCHERCGDLCGNGASYKHRQIFRVGRRWAACYTSVGTIWYHYIHSGLKVAGSEIDRRTSLSYSGHLNCL